MSPRFFYVLFFLCPFLLGAQSRGGPGGNSGGQELFIGPGDLRIEQRVDGGFHLFIRKTAGVGSVLLTESTRDPQRAADNYAYRAPERNAVNGGELRVLDGRVIPESDKIWSLIDSTPEYHAELGAAFHIYIPYILNYGYESGRHGEIYVVDGTYFNIRAFALPYADYRGPFRDNPFVLRVTQRPLPGPPEGNYMEETEKSFTEISARGGGELFRSTGPADLVDRIEEILKRERGRTLDLVICLDTTGSMKDDIDAVRKALIPMLEKILPSFPDFRIGMVLYKDYYEEYLTRPVGFTRDFKQFQRALNGITPRGGRDLPEAVYEALYEGALRFPWEAESRLMILIGDAPPHLRQRGRVSDTMVYQLMEEKSLRVHAIILPQ